jgi:hypothetical protein
MTLRLQSVTGELEGICTLDEMLLRDVKENEELARRPGHTFQPVGWLAGTSCVPSRW